MEKYNNKSKFHSRVTLFWEIQNNKPVTDILNKLGNRKAAKFV